MDHSVVRNITARGVAALVLAACCSPRPYVADVDATAIVRQNSADAFATFFEPDRDGAAFRAFDQKVVLAHTRAELTIAWQSVPTLSRHGGAFLDEHVFSKAVQERKWPKESPAASLETAFVQGVHGGVQDFLAPR